MPAGWSPGTILFDRVWGYHYVGDSKTLDVHVKRLRSKVEIRSVQPVTDRHDSGSRLQVHSGRPRSPVRSPAHTRLSSRWLRPRKPLEPADRPAVRSAGAGHDGDVSVTPSPDWRGPTASLLAATHSWPFALADSVFFSLDPNDARWRVSLYLLLTVAPFAVVAQFLGPLVDRVSGGNKFIIVGVGLRRGLMAVLMATQVESLLFFPMAFSMLVMGKAHHIAKSALVPSLIDDPHNSFGPTAACRSSGRLGDAAFVPFAGLLVFFGACSIRSNSRSRLGGASWGLVFAGVLFAIGGVLALQIPTSRHRRSSGPGTTLT